ncbi:MAG: hypothetical protein ACFB22_03385 [Rhodothalassiaceae bacterium]
MQGDMLAFALYALTATVGVIMALRWFRGQASPISFAIAHLILAGLGAWALLAFLFGGDRTASFTYAAIAFGLAALGGLYLGSFHFRKKAPPRGIISAHGGIAVLGILLLGFGLLYA